MILIKVNKDKNNKYHQLLNSIIKIVLVFVSPVPSEHLIQ